MYGGAVLWSRIRTSETVVLCMSWPKRAVRSRIDSGVHEIRMLSLISGELQ